MCAEPNERTADGVEIVTIHGPLDHHASWWWDSYDAILARVEGAMTGQFIAEQHKWRNSWKDDYQPLDPTPARAVILRIDSPGGDAAGATYAHRKLRKMRAQYDIPLYAYADEMACSAGYEIACAADEIWLPDTGVVGSIGVIATMFDRTGANEKAGVDVELVTSGEYKADGHADRPLTSDILGRTQQRVDELADVFFSVVAEARGTTPSAIAGLQAATFCGHVAVDVGVADGVAGWDRFLKTVTRTLDSNDEDAFDASAADAA